MVPGNIIHFSEPPWIQGHYILLLLSPLAAFPCPLHRALHHPFPFPHPLVLLLVKEESCQSN